MAKGDFVYAVQRGRKTGVFNTWGEAEGYVKGFPGSKFRKFPAGERQVAVAWVNGTGGSASGVVASGPPDRGWDKHRESEGQPSKRARKEFIDISSDHTGPIYAVRRGHRIGLFPDWVTTEPLVHSFPRAKFLKFAPGQYAEAKAWAEQSEVVPSTRQVHESITPREGPKPSKMIILGEDELPGDGTSIHAQAIRVRADKWAQVSDRYPAYVRSTLERFALSEPEAMGQGKVNVWCDGSSLSNGNSSARAGWGVYFPSTSAYAMYTEARRLSGKLQTNNRGELMAIGRACEIVPPHVEVRIYTDSQYSILALTRWFDKWATNDWKTSDGKEVQNKTLLVWIRTLFDHRSVPPELIHVKGHADDVGNMAADCLARLGAMLPEEEVPLPLPPK